MILESYFGLNGKGLIEVDIVYRTKISCHNLFIIYNFSQKKEVAAISIF